MNNSNPGDMADGVGDAAHPVNRTPSSANRAPMSPGSRHEGGPCSMHGEAGGSEAVPGPPDRSRRPRLVQGSGPAEGAPAGKAASKKKALDKATLDNLRQQAVARTKSKPAGPAKKSSDQALVHELEVREVELQLQNEELQAAWLEVAEARDRYADLFEFAPVGYLTLGVDRLIVEANLTAGTMLGVQRRRLIGSRLEDFVMAPCRPVWRSHLKQVAGTGDKQSCVLSFHSAGDEPFHARIETAPITAAGFRLTGYRVTLNDITQLKNAEAELRRLAGLLEQIVHERTSELELLRDIAFMANEAESLDSALRYCLWRVSRHNGWSFGQAYLASDDDFDILRPAISCYNEASKRFEKFRELTMQRPVRRGEGLVGRVYGSAHPEWSTEISEDWVVRRSEVVDAVEIQTAAAFPILSGTRVVGVLGFYCDKAIEPTERILESMASVGAQLGRVVERNRLEREIVTATTSEQQRLARELHDSVGQDLTGAAMLANTLISRLESQSSPDTELAAKVVENLDAAKANFRTVIRNIALERIDGSGLAGSLDELARRTSEWYRLDCVLRNNLTAEDLDRLDEVTTAQLFHIAREAVHNAVKHARANQIWLELDKSDNRISLAVGDDGVGMPANRDSAGFGLRVMQRRAGVIAADLAIESKNGQGTVIRCRLSADGLEGRSH